MMVRVLAHSLGCHPPPDADAASPAPSYHLCLAMCIHPACISRGALRRHSKHAFQACRHLTKCGRLQHEQGHAQGKEYCAYCAFTVAGALALQFHRCSDALGKA